VTDTPPEKKKEVVSPVAEASHISKPVVSEPITSPSQVDKDLDKQLANIESNTPL